jgi:hypothetical protein
VGREGKDEGLFINGASSNLDVMLCFFASLLSGQSEQFDILERPIVNSECGRCSRPSLA